MDVYFFKKSMYSKEALFKASYTFIDNFYVHLSSDFENYIVHLKAKDNTVYPNVEEFQNEMLIQETRKIVNERTMKIREIMYSRAMASTVIEETQELEDENSENAQKILVDWFEKDE